MKTLITFALAFCISMTASASSGAVQGLNQLMNDYHYSMTVEWDQTDSDFQKNTTAQFSKGMKKLIQEKGLTKEELLSVLESRVKSQEELAGLKLKVSLLPKDLSEEQEIVYLLNSVEQGNQGASWNGEVLAKSFLAIVVVFMAISLANSIQQGECVERSSELRETCDDGGCYEYYPCLQRENDSWF